MTLSQQTLSGQSAQGLPQAPIAHDDDPPDPFSIATHESSPSEGMGDNSEYSEEGEEPENYNPTPVRGLELVAGNGPVPRERGNIGESIGTAPEPSNGV